MVLITENGWPQCSRDECETVSVPGTNKVRLVVRAGDAATVLCAWAAWFHRNIRSIEPPDGHQNWWYWDPVDSVWNSNHLSGTAIDLCADELNQYRYDMPQDQVTKVQQGLSLFEANIYWGRDWGAGDQDEMHFQCGYDTWNNPRFAQFAQRLRDGYLNIFGPPDPLAFPLPLGYYYGPLEGPDNCISGDYATDSQAAKDGLGRWQEKLGLPVTKHWDDATAKARPNCSIREAGNPTRRSAMAGCTPPNGTPSCGTTGSFPKTGMPPKSKAPKFRWSSGVTTASTKNAALTSPTRIRSSASAHRSPMPAPRPRLAMGASTPSSSTT
ncbi:M15 family metallopeptidase [Mycobacterium szulgai]|nr:M15 family metallopeptidase [Mycobacterium szulgai]